MYHNLKTTLYHGTISDISKVDVTLGRSRKDFGRGFYMATSKAQAVGMMHKKYREAVRRSHYLFWLRLAISSTLLLHRIFHPALDLFQVRIPAARDRRGLVLPKLETAMSVYSLQKLHSAMPVAK